MAQVLHRCSSKTISAEVTILHIRKFIHRKLIKTSSHPSNEIYTPKTHQAQVTCLRVVIFSKFSETAAVKFGSSNPSSAPSLQQKHKAKNFHILSREKAMLTKRIDKQNLEGWLIMQSINWGSKEREGSVQVNISLPTLGSPTLYVSVYAKEEKSNSFL